MHILRKPSSVLNITKWSEKWKFSAFRDDVDQKKAVSELLNKTRISFRNIIWPFEADLDDNMLDIKIKNCLDFTIDLENREGLPGDLTPKTRG